MGDDSRIHDHGEKASEASKCTTIETHQLLRVELISWDVYFFQKLHFLPTSSFIYFCHYCLSYNQPL